MKVGDLVKLYNSALPRSSPLWWDSEALEQRIGLVVDIDKHDNPVVNVDGVIKAIHRSQVSGVVNET